MAAQQVKRMTFGNAARKVMMRIWAEEIKHSQLHVTVNRGHKRSKNSCSFSVFLSCYPVKCLKILKSTHIYLRNKLKNIRSLIFCEYNQNAQFSIKIRTYLPMGIRKINLIQRENNFSFPTDTSFSLKTN